MLRLALRDEKNDGISLLERARINGLSFDSDQRGRMSVHKFHALLDLLSERGGWELEVATATPALNAPETRLTNAGGAVMPVWASYRIICKRPLAG